MWWGATKAFFAQLGKDGAEVLVGEIPYAGDVVAAKEAIEGTNVYGERLSGLERVLTAGSLVPGGKILGKAAGNAIGAASSLLGAGGGGAGAVVGPRALAAAWAG